MKRAARSLPWFTLIGMLLLTTSCGHFRPNTFVHYPEYGTLPVDNARGHTRALPLYVALDRDSLPQTEAEARPIAEANAARLREERRGNENTETPLYLPVALVGLPVILPAFVVADAMQHKTIEKEYEERVARERAEFEARLAERGVEVTVHVTDASGRDVEGARVLPLAWPIRHRTYGGPDGLRWYPRTPRVEFKPSSELSTLLANTMLEDREAMKAYLRLNGIEVPEDRTDSIGVWTHVNPLLAYVPSEWAVTVGRMTADQFEGPFDVHYLVACEGYSGTFASARIARDGPRTVNLEVGLVARDAGKTEGDNPWQVARALREQVVYYERKLNDESQCLRPPDGPAPLKEEAFERFLDAALRVAPEFPLTHKARFWYDVERGDLEAARRHSIYVDDYACMYVFHGVEWYPGEVLD